MFERLPTKEEASVWGLTPEQFKSSKTILVWPENRKAVQFFMSLPAGAWSYVGMGGIAVGIRPESLPELRLSLGVADSEWPAMYSDFRVMERAAVEAMRPAED